MQYHQPGHPVNSEYGARYTAYQSQRSLLRKWVRRLYLRSACSQLAGPTLDFGCGIGELLERLPAGSLGLEYNQATVAHCVSRGLPVQHYDGFADDWSMTALSPRLELQSMVISHVLEHLEQPVEVLNKLLRSAERLGIQRVLVIVPGKAGFRIDPTHLTFVDKSTLSRHEAVADTAFTMASSRYFPGNLRGIGDRFPHHELQVCFTRPANRQP